MFLKIFLPFLSFVILYSSCAAAPWHLDPASQEKIRLQIEERHAERLAGVAEGVTYFKDQERKRTNYSAKDCPFCQSGNPGLKLEEKLAQAGFVRMKTINRLPGHCFGACCRFVQMFLEESSAFTELSCQEMLNQLAIEPDFMEWAHIISMNQPISYAIEWPPASKELYSVAANAKVEALFLETIIGKKVASCYSLLPEQVNPKEFTQEAIYATLQRMPDKILLVSLQSPKSPHYHSVVLSTFADRLLIFDPDWGILHFRDLETMSKILGDSWNQSALRRIASFSR